MTRVTIDYGIDLGTTNSVVAVLQRGDAEVVKNNEGSDITPSAVYVDKHGALSVGLRAKNLVEARPESTAAEFKLRMGTRGQGFHFASDGRVMEPEELSAEVLKSLRADVLRRKHEDIGAAVITVPAAFELNQTDATRRAAELAGLTFAPLIQEPTAAAFAYGLHAEGDNRFWMVYDLGGGTFDAAVVHLKDGAFTVANHRGDNYLGGKQIDWAIVERLLIPAMASECSLDGLARGEPRWMRTVAKLKAAAEEAKIALSRQAATVVEYDGFDDRDRRITFEYQLTRAELERLAEPFYARSIKICRQALAEADLAADNVEKVLLVGGQTLSPQLREMVAGELGIELDFSEDPLTVVARGAAVFAGTQILPPDTSRRRPGQYLLAPEYSPIGTDPEPWVGGTVTGDSDGLPAGVTVEFVNADAAPAWRSGKVAVGESGTFVTQLFAEEGRQTTFQVELTDGSGRRLDVTPDRITYTWGAVEPYPLLTGTIGLALADNELLEILPKGSPLPARARRDLRTTVDVQPGSGTGMIRIPVVDGEHARADRNRRVGTLEVHPSDLSRDVPAGSDVEVTVEIDGSQIVHATAFVPLLDQEFTQVIDLANEPAPDRRELEEAAKAVRDRYERLRGQADDVGNLPARAVVEEIASDGRLESLDAAVARSAAEPEAAGEAAKRASALQAEMDEAERALRWPALVRGAEDLLDATDELVRHDGDDEDARRFADYQRQLRQAIEAGDADLLEQRCTELATLAGTLLRRHPSAHTALFGDLVGRRAEMRDQARAARLIDEGEQALLRGDTDVLQNVNRQLAQLLPFDSPAVDVLPGWESTVRRNL